MTVNLFLESLKNNPFLIMAHRGFWGGNVVENSIESSFLAYKAGADIVEVDICRTLDGKYYLFHDKEETRLLSRTENFKELSSTEIENNSVNNSLGNVSGYKINSLVDFLRWLPENKLVNLDRSWEYWDDEEFFGILKSSRKQHQLVLKSPVEKVFLDNFAKYGKNLSYVPILINKQELDCVLSYKQIDIIGVEVIVSDLTSDFMDKKWVEFVHDHNLFIIANAENLGLGFNLFGGLNDNEVLLDESGWNSFIEFGVDVIQTDWPNFLYEYREKNKKMVNKWAVMKSK